VEFTTQSDDVASKAVAMPSPLTIPIRVSVALSGSLN